MIKGLNIKVLISKMAQVQVVSKGMKWTQKAAEAAAQQHQYIKVGEKPGHLLLTGAVGRWKKPQHAGDVYVPSLRVAGNPAVIRNLFLGLGVAGQTIDQHLARAYTLQNHAQPGFREAFDAEVEAYRVWKEGHDATKRATGAGAVRLDQLQYFVDQLQAASTVARTAAGSPAAAAAGRVSPGRAPRVRALADRLADATKKGKVLDVSKMDLAKGTGIKMINPPGANSKKVGVAGLALVSSNAANYAHAVRNLGANYEGYIQRYAERAAQGTTLGAAPAVVSPVVGRVPTLPVATSPLAGGVALPMIPGTLGVRPATTLPIGSPGTSPRGF